MRTGGGARAGGVGAGGVRTGVGDRAGRVRIGAGAGAGRVRIGGGAGAGRVRTRGDAGAGRKLPIRDPRQFQDKNFALLLNISDPELIRLALCSGSFFLSL